LSNRASSLIPIPELISDGDLIPLVNERLLRVDQELGRLDTRVSSIVIPAAAAPVNNLCLAAVATAGVAGGGAYANVTGCQLTLTKAGVWEIHATIRGIINVGGSLLVGQVLVTPVVGAPAALPGNIVLLGAAAHHATVSQTWKYTATLNDQLDLQMVGVGTATDPVTPGVGYSSTITATWIND
jgi:hypothetical protein